jgi:serine protein kinase
MDLSKIGEYGSESDPRAFRFDGELNISNRGMMEFVEMLKVDQKFLYVLLTLAQEKNIKTGRFPFIYADEFLLAHTNETEYRRFIAKEEMEALHDRIIVVKIPYNLRVSDEVKIYEKLINQSNFGDVHVSPYTLYCAAMFAVLSRLKDSKHEGLSMMSKMRLYNGEEVEGFSKSDIPLLKSEFEAEGMSGVSPRYVINRISSTLSEEGTTCITPIDAIRSIRDGFVSNPKLDRAEIDRLENILTKVIEEYSKIAKNEVQKAFFLKFEKEVSNLLKNYMDQIEAFLDGKAIEDEWGDMQDPDERLMRSIEEKINVTDSGKKSFRQEIYRKMLKSANESNGEYNYKDHPKLREALEKQLFDERQDVIRLTVSTRNPDEDELKRINVVIEALCDKYNYTAESANKLLKYVSSLMARN